MAAGRGLGLVWGMAGLRRGAAGRQALAAAQSPAHAPPRLPHPPAAHPPLSPQGVIVAAPVYAATGSRWKALGLATASGLSEPLGALLALVLVKPFLTEARLHYILGFVGGLMAAVSLLELWPEARKCRNDRRMWLGIGIGVAVMGATLLYV